VKCLLKKKEKVVAMIRAIHLNIKKYIPSFLEKIKIKIFKILKSITVFQKPINPNRINSNLKK
jgi:hypothetical protein